MCGMLETLVFLIFGIIALAKGEFKITKNRKVRGSVSRVLGVLLLIAAGIPYVIENGVWIRWGILLLVIIVGLVTSEIIGQEKKPPATITEAPEQKEVEQTAKKNQA